MALRPTLALLAALLGGGMALSLAAAPAPVLCRVTASSVIHPLGRAVTVTLRPGCPPGGLARIRLASGLGGSQPDSPPGAYTLRPLPGRDSLTRVVLPWWWVQWLSASGTPYPVPEEGQ
ncbi:hypothetical protein [uncultured Deinococcus sp.]|uniref:hypothetical protein n=1 Tax=uncultured Deinococcus sp. TaxID=158789 RepID=UPI0025850542|nr:hypothetical protein [uncultured Deinococcus sp.]